jgi:hypothetical protein
MIQIKPISSLKKFRNRTESQEIPGKYLNATAAGTFGKNILDLSDISEYKHTQ